jgi:hypothetical protein
MVAALFAIPCVDRATHGGRWWLWVCASLWLSLVPFLLLIPFIAALLGT